MPICKFISYKCPIRTLLSCAGANAPYVRADVRPAAMPRSCPLAGAAFEGKGSRTRTVSGWVFSLIAGLRGC